MSESMQWYWITYYNGWGHMVIGDLLDTVRADMDRQDPPGILQSVEPMEPEDCKLYIDWGGMMAVDRPLEIIVFLGLEVVIPSEDLSNLVLCWSRSAAIKSAGRSFYRFASNGRSSERIIATSCWICYARGQTPLKTAPLRSTRSVTRRSRLCGASTKRMEPSSSTVPTGWADFGSREFYGFGSSSNHAYPLDTQE